MRKLQRLQYIFYCVVWVLLLVLVWIVIAGMCSVGIGALWTAAVESDYEVLLRLGAFALGAFGLILMAIAARHWCNRSIHNGKLCPKHIWNGCTCWICEAERDTHHDWVDCHCRICGKTRDNHHAWDGCRCYVCGARRDAHHRYRDCTCIGCGKVRDEGHRWKNGRCEVCGLEQQPGLEEFCNTGAPHVWQGCVCTVCGRTRHQPDEHCRCSICGETVHVWNFTESRSVHNPRLLKNGVVQPDENETIILDEFTCARCGETKEAYMRDDDLMKALPDEK